MPGCIANALVGCVGESAVPAKLSSVPFPSLNSISPASHFKGGYTTGPLVAMGPPGVVGACANTANADPASPMHVIAASRARRVCKDFMAITFEYGSIKKASICLARTFEAALRSTFERHSARIIRAVSATTVHRRSAELCFWQGYNPAMFVLDHIIKGCICEMVHTLRTILAKVDG